MSAENIRTLIVARRGMPCLTSTYRVLPAHRSAALQRVGIPAGVGAGLDLFFRNLLDGTRP